MKKTKIINCLVCRKEIEVGLNNTTKKFCSRTCQYEAKKKNKVEKIKSYCLVCRKEIQHRPKEERKYCSLKCRWVHLKVVYKGENNPRWKVQITEEERVLRKNITTQLWQDDNFRQKVKQGLDNAREKVFKETGCSLGWTKEDVVKRKQTTLGRHGVEHNWGKLNGERRACDDTCLSKHGKENWELMQDGAWKVGETSIEKTTRDILAKNKISFKRQYRIYYEKRKCKVYDFYLPELNLLIEIDGDYWHVNPLMFKGKLTENQIKNKINDEFKNQLAVINKMKLIRFWGSEVETPTFETTFLKKINEKV